MKRSKTSSDLSDLNNNKATNTQLTSEEVREIATKMIVEAKLGDILVGFEKTETKKSKGSRVEQLKRQAKEEGYPSSQVKPIGTRVYGPANNLLDKKDHSRK